MNANSIRDFLKETILELKDIDEDQLTDELTMAELALESLDYVEIQVLVNKRYGLLVNTELFLTGKLSTFGDVVAYIAAHQVAKEEETA